MPIQVIKENQVNMVTEAEPMGGFKYMSKHMELEFGIKKVLQIIAEQEFIKITTKDDKARDYAIECIQTWRRILATVEQQYKDLGEDNSDSILDSVKHNNSKEDDYYD